MMKKTLEYLIPIIISVITSSAITILFELYLRQ